MKWILILVVGVSQPQVTQVRDLHSEAACKLAGEVVMKEAGKNAYINYACIPQGEQE